jgi:tellurite resistance protein
VAPPAVGGNAWFALSGSTDLFHHALLGTFVLFLLMQLALIPTYARLPFGLGFWALTVTTAASGTYDVHWLAATRPAGVEASTVLILALVTLTIGWVAVRSVPRARGASCSPNTFTTRCRLRDAADRSQ